MKRREQSDVQGVHSHQLQVLIVMLRPENSPGRPTGGGQIAAIQTAVALRDLGTRVWLLEGKPSILRGFDQVPEAFTLSADRNLLADTIGTVRAVRKTTSDAIYAFSDFFPETLVPSLLASLITRKKLFVSITSTAYSAFDGRKFIGLLRSRKSKTPGEKSLLSFAIFHGARRLAFRMGTCLVMDNFMESYAKSRLHARRTFVVGGGVEKLWYKRAEGEKSFDCVYSGRFDPSKRVSTLIRAWQIVVRRKPDARLLLIGNSGTELPLVRSLVDGFGLSSNVVFSDYIANRQGLADKVKSARVFVFPSVQEGFGLSIAEAMAAGLPCVLSDVEPLREVFGEAALLVRKDDPPAFADAILGLLLDESKRLECGTRSESLAESFSWDKVGKRFQAALRES